MPEWWWRRILLRPGRAVLNTIRKRHRDGTSSRPHHKKVKEATAKDLSKGNAGAAAGGASSSTPIKACRSYAEKVTLSFLCCCSD